VTVETLLQQIGIRYRLAGDEAVAKCPYHNDGHPSWSVNINSGIFYCFACGAKGNLAKLIHDFLSISYEEAAIKANETVGFAKMDKWRENYDNVSFSPMAMKVSEMDMALFTDPPQDALKSKNITITDARQYEIMWNPVNETWVCPYRDPYSYELWGWQEKNHRIFRNFPPGTRRGRTLFGIQPVHNRTALVESPIDCAVIHHGSAGFIGAVASFGRPSLYQLQLLNERCDDLILALDNDSPGKAATKDLIYEAVRMFKTVKVYNYGMSQGKDPGEQLYDAVDYGLRHAIPALTWLRGA